MSKPFGWAFIGAGTLGAKVAKQITASGRHRIVSIYVRNPEKRAAFAKTYGAMGAETVEQAINAPGVDGVYIVTPHTSHYDYAKLALELGRPVLCEKPVSTDAEKVSELLRLSEEKGVYFTEAMWTWFAPVANKIKQWYDAGEYGELKKFHMTYHLKSVNYAPRVADPKLAGGALLDIGIYPITYACRLLGKPERVECTGTLKGGIDLGEEIKLTFPGGKVCTISTSITDMKGLERLTLSGTKASTDLMFYHGANRVKLKRRGGPSETFTGSGSMLNEFDLVSSEIREGLTESRYVPHAATLDVMEVMDECRRQMGLVYPFEIEADIRPKAISRWCGQQTESSGAMKATHLRVDYLTAPLGLGNPKPRFYWNCQGGMTQTAYRILCSRGGETVWDSGKVASSSMTHIPYGGETLHSRDIISWSVTLWDENDRPGETAESTFELGLLEPSDWTAKWISGNYSPDPKKRYPADCFKRTFRIHGAVRKARLYATARGVYDVTVNGHRLEDFILAPGSTDYRKRIQYQTYDVTALLAEDNTIELRLADGWFRGSVAAYGVRNVFGTQTSVLAQLEIEGESGKRVTLGTDKNWAWSGDGPLRFADLKDGEVYNAAMAPSYDGKAVEVAPPKDAVICASDNVPVLEHERLTAKLLPGGVLDFGQNIAGYLEFHIKGKKGQGIRIVCSELYDKESRSVVQNAVETRPAEGWTRQKLIRKLLTGTVSGDAALTPLQEIRFTCSGGEDHYKTSFAVFGFRYAQIIGDVEIIPGDFTAIAVYSDLEQTGDFVCSNAMINKLVENTRWSMKGNFLDVPTDCPTRERLGWTGDAQVFFDTGAYLMDTAPFFRKWLRDVADGQYRDGSISSVAPFSGVEMMYKATGGSVGWADAIYLVPYRYWKRFGDDRLLRECWPMIKRYADGLLGKIEKDGHYEKGVHLGEWLEPEEFRDAVYGTKAKHPEECTAYLYLAMTTIAEIAEALGEDSQAYRTAAQRAMLIYPAYAELDTDRQAKLVRPLALGLLGGEQKQNVQNRLKAAVERYRYRVGTGFLSTPFILPVLTEAGEAETAYRMLENTDKPGWLYEVLQGATTVWETWEGYTGKGDMGSLNHYSPGAVCQWLFDTVAGIRVEGENHFVISPVPGGSLTHAGASYQSIYGRVESRWEKTDGGISYTITVPAGCRATLRLPDGTAEELTAGVYEYVR